MLRPSLLARLIFSSLAGLHCAHAQAPQYTGQFIESTTQAHVYALSPSGVAVGWLDQAGFQRAWVGGVGQSLTVLPLPAGSDASIAYGINASGVICGVHGTAFSIDSPALWVPSGAGTYAFVPLALLSGATVGAATAINDLGDVVGWSGSGADARMTLFSAPGGPLEVGSGVPSAINNQRVLVFLGGGTFSPKRLDLNTLVVEDLGLPTGVGMGFTSVHVADINEFGQVVGSASAWVTGSCKSQAVSYSTGTGWQLLSNNCGISDRAYSVNNFGDVVMQQQEFVPMWQTLAVHVTGAGLYPLKGQIDAGAWTFAAFSGAAINDAGDIALIANRIDQGLSQTGLFVLHRIDACQANLGYGGPGHSYLSLCGGNLSSGTQAQLKLVGAAPLQPALLVVGTASQPTPLFGGTVVPLQSSVLLAPFVSDAAGSIVTPPIVGGGGPLTLYAQFGYLDPLLPQSVGLSNALRVELLP